MMVNLEINELRLELAVIEAAISRWDLDIQKGKNDTSIMKVIESFGFDYRESWEATTWLIIHQLMDYKNTGKMGLKRDIKQVAKSVLGIMRGSDGALNA